MTRYPIREPNHGVVVAYHCREDGPGGKDVWWEQPDGTRGLAGLRTEDLPLYGAAAWRRWQPERPVIVVEGEKAAYALTQARWQAVGTVTGAGGCPGREALLVLVAEDVILWPDNDAAGRAHMQRVAAILGDNGEAITASTRWLEWPDAPPGGDAADALAAGVDVAALVAAAGPLFSDDVPDEPQRRAAATPIQPPWRDRAGESPIERFNAAVGVTTVLGREWGVDAQPGRTVRCPAHDDRSPSLSIAADDRRVWCHSPGCPLNDDGRGADAWALAQVAAATP